jgi:peptide/nickel transport system substrate-binding protein
MWSRQCCLEKLSLIRAAVLTAVLLGILPAIGPKGICEDAAVQPLRITDSSKAPVTLHPHNSFDPNSDLIISQIFEGLIDYNAEGQLVPRLALRWEKLSPTRFRFWLRRGVAFHNGEPFDAQAVRFSLDQQLRGKRPSANAWLFDPRFRAEVVSDHVVDLLTDLPDARLPYTLPTFFKIIPPRFVREQGHEALARHPVGTGPYRFVSPAGAEGIRLDANPAYWKAGLPRIKALEFRFIDHARQVQALLQGEVDLITKLGGKDTLQVMQGTNTKVLKRHVAAVFWAAMKNHDSPFAHLKVRQAMNYAINKRHLIQYVEKGNSLQIPSMTNPLEIGYNPELRSYPFDPDKARQMLHDAGFAQGFKARVLVEEESKDMAFAIRSQVRMIGVELDIQVVSREEYLRQTIIPKLVHGRPSFDGDMVIWLTPNPTLNAFFNPAVIFYSGSPYSIMQDAEFDRIYRDFVNHSDPQAIRASLFDLQAYMFEQAFGIYTSQRVRTIGLRRELQINLDPTGALFGFTLMEAYWQDPSSYSITTDAPDPPPAAAEEIQQERQ